MSKPKADPQQAEKPAGAPQTATPADPRPEEKPGQGGGTYGQGDFSPAAQRTRLRSDQNQPTSAAGLSNDGEPAPGASSGAA